MYRRTLALATVVALGVGGVLAQAQDTKKAAPAQAKAAAPGPIGTLKDVPQQAAYGFGLNVGRQVKSQLAQVGLDPKLVAKGVADALTDAQPLMTDQQIQAAMQEFEKSLMAKAQAAADANKKKGVDFLEANKKKANIKSTASGLQYEVLKEGAGPSPKASDTVSTHYKGTLIDGKQFDSSYDRGEPTSFPVGNVIKGWSEALQLMKVGSKYRLFIPAELAYGEQGTPDGVIPPNSPLIFEVELLGIEAKK